ncbi:MAG: hypothetical protein IKS31_01180 [Clostridia bacterium]|nr:hypothetical protein [Clostridia bacterium]
MERYITFGRYPQTSGRTDSTPIEWQVLEARDGKALVISRYGLDVKAYNTYWVDVTWETCTLRSWLNNEFMKKAFRATEQSAILTTMVDNSRGQGFNIWSTNGGNDTQDKIFLLSYAEAHQFFGVTHDDHNNKKARVAPTAYAIALDALTANDKKTADRQAAGWWWLRSPGSDQAGAANVDSDGSLCHDYVGNGRHLVRPAFWLALSSDIFF